jgi:copper chaperone CopZ
VDVDLEKNRLRVDYDPAKVTTDEMLAAVAKQEFTATIVSGDAQTAPP